METEFFTCFCRQSNFFDCYGIDQGSSMNHRNNKNILKDRRNRLQPIPEHIEDHINQAQTLSLRKLQLTGWKLEFVRRSTGSDAVVFVTNPNQQKIGTIEKSGLVDTYPKIPLRVYDTFNRSESL
jgi:hypothetical protein